MYLKEANINKLFFLSGGIEPGDEESIKDVYERTGGPKIVFD